MGQVIHLAKTTLGLIDLDQKTLYPTPWFA
jgi:hypothetical protein